MPYPEGPPVQRSEAGLDHGSTSTYQSPSFRRIHDAPETVPSALGPRPPRPPSPPSEKMKNVRIDEGNVVKTSYKPPCEFVVCRGTVWFACILVASGTFGWCFGTLWSLVAFLVRLFTCGTGWSIVVHTLWFLWFTLITSGILFGLVSFTLITSSTFWSFVVHDG